MLSNPLEDLNAANQAELQLIAGQWDSEYREALEPLCGQYATIYRASALHRIMAIVKLLGKH